MYCVWQSLFTQHDIFEVTKSKKYSLYIQNRTCCCSTYILKWFDMQGGGWEVLKGPKNSLNQKNLKKCKVITSKMLTTTT